MTREHLASGRVTLFAGDCLDVLAGMPENSVDAVVTDPPYLLNFMAKKWDRAKVAEIDPDFANWLAGFIDGEGCFSVHKKNVNGFETFDCQFTITLRDDDRSVIETIKRELGGIGTIALRPARDGNAQVRYCISSQRDCLRLREILMVFPLRAKKLRDFEIWSRALDSWINHEKGEWEDMAYFRRHLMAVKRYGSHYHPEQLFHYEWARQVYRVLKPGGHMLAMGGTRTFHRLVCAIEDAGFEVRDTVMWVYGCLDDQTHVATIDGVKPHHKTKVGDLVLCYDVLTSTYSYQPILEIVEYDYNDTAYRLVGDFGEQVVTRNHRCIIERSGNEILQIAEEAARQCKARVPILENLCELQQALSDAQQGTSGAQLDVFCNMQRGMDKQTKTWSHKTNRNAQRKVRGSLLRLWQAVLAQYEMACESGKASLFTTMQRCLAWGGVETPRPQSARRVESGGGGEFSAAVDRSRKSGLEGRADVSESQGEIRRSADQIRALHSALSAHGAEGWLRDGASVGCCDGDWAVVDAFGIGPSPRPRCDEQPSEEFDAFRDKRGTQGIRAWRGHCSTLVRIVPFRHVGKVWCLRVPTGAFVAVRGGVAFPTGNSGFPKSRDVSKGIDRNVSAGRIGWFGEWLRAERERRGISQKDLAERGKFFKNVNHGGLVANWELGYGIPTAAEFNRVCDILQLPFQRIEEAEREVIGKRNVNAGVAFSSIGPTELEVTAPATDAAREWDGWGTALKPAVELICLARKPLSEGTIAANVLAHGTGAIHVDACRVGVCGQDDYGRSAANANGTVNAHNGFDGKSFKISERDGEYASPLGRWPANLIHDGSDEVLAAFPETEPAKSSMRGEQHSSRHGGLADIGGNIKAGTDSLRGHEDNGGSAARFFKQVEPDANRLWYSSKADADDRLGSKHPTVKPVDLIQYLARLITPPGGLILDCFAGTGTLGEAAIREGFRAVLIEREAAYCADIRRRMTLASAGPVERRHESIKARGKVDHDAGPLFAQVEAAE